MRKILFRGKHTHSNEWVNGFFIDRSSVNEYKITDGFGLSYYVNPGTVGQYTGLNDKNETKIFEDDIVKQTMVVNYEEIERVAKISFIDGAYWLEYANSQVFRLSQNTIDVYKLEVIGNIHDNPEMLEVGNE